MTRPPWDPRNTAAWQKLRAQVIHEEPTCWLQLPGCTIRSTTADHLINVKDNPALALDRRNCRGACRPCNTARLNTRLEDIPNLRARLIAKHNHTIAPAQIPPALGIFRP